MKHSSILLGCLFTFLATSALAAPNVVVSIKPIHSLVASVMKGVAQPLLIVEGSASPHTYQMKPSQASALQQADVIFWTGHGLEAFLEKPLETIGSKAKIVELEDAPGLTKLKLRAGGAFESHEGEPENNEAGNHEEAHGDFDMHFWLDTNNAKAMAVEIEKTLTAADPANAATYKANLTDLNARIDALASEIDASLASVKQKPFIVFHDAYQYFEHRFAVRVAGSITISPEVMPGAERISQIKAKVVELGATCVFSEPQFQPATVDIVLEGTTAKSGVLDPEAGALTPGPELYFELMRSISSSLKSCLSPG